MSFATRIGQAMEFEEALFGKLNQMGFRTAVNGTEHTHPEFVSNLRKSTDPTSLAIRFQPDGVACFGDVPSSFYVEAKNARSIEKTAWDQYCILADRGSILVIVFQPLEWRWAFIETLALVPGSVTVGRFPRPLPVRDDWICPREAADWGERVDNGFKGCGTPYREVDATSLLPWAEFKSEVRDRLKRK